jgi:hypothetical protein
VKPPASIESEDASRPTGAEEGLRRRAASATDGVASPVGNCEIEEIACPHEEQKRTESASSAEQLGHRITLTEILPQRLRRNGDPSLAGEGRAAAQRGHEAPCRPATAMTIMTDSRRKFEDSRLIGSDSTYQVKRPASRTKTDPGQEAIQRTVLQMTSGQ